MKKMKIPKPRNPFVQHLIARKGAVHKKSKKTLRRNEKAALKKEWMK